jgi:hypothetical protein
MEDGMRFAVSRGGGKEGGKKTTVCYEKRL